MPSWVLCSFEVIERRKFDANTIQLKSKSEQAWMAQLVARQSADHVIEVQASAREIIYSDLLRIILCWAI